MATKTAQKPKVCRECGKLGSEENPLSRRLLHFECGLNRAVEAARQMAAKEGPHYEMWKRNYAHASLVMADRFRD